jgi:hypothetical protein
VTRGTVDLEWLALSLAAQVKTLSGQIQLLDAHVELLVDRLADEQHERGAADVVVLGFDPVTGSCAHPEDARLDAGTMRAPLRFFCKACRAFVNPGRDSEREPASASRSPVD